MRRTLNRKIPAALILALGVALVHFGSGALVTLGMWFALLTVLLSAKYLMPTNLLERYRFVGEGVNALALVLSSVFVTMLVIEGILWAIEKHDSHEEAVANTAATTMVMPEELKERPANVLGAARAYYWLNKLHVYNSDSFRHIGDYVRSDSAHKIVVVGDSLTYGVGVAAEDAYPAVLEGILKRKNSKLQLVVYSLGVPGRQSEDVARIAEKWVPRLKPEIVIYGICQNDFLPSLMGQYANNMRWQFPLPRFIKKPLETKTRVGSLFADRYNRLLMSLGVRNDFYTDILRDIGNYQERFSRDLHRLNALAMKETGRPVLAMVLDQFPGEANTTSDRITRMAERIAREAGMDVVPTDDYYRKYAGSGVQLYVSHWEGHPNERAHRIFAEMIAEHLMSHGVLRAKAELPAS